MIEAAQRGETVVRLKAGDPLIFGRALDEFQILQDHGIGMEIVPGITAMAGAAASIGLPLTIRGVSSGVNLETGHLARIDRLGGENTRVVYMPKAKIKEYCESLLASGSFCPETPAAYVTAASSAIQGVTEGSLADLPGIVSSYRGLAPGARYYWRRLVETL